MLLKVEKITNCETVDSLRFSNSTLIILFLLKT